MTNKINEILEKADHNYAHEFAKELSLLGNDNSILGFRTSGSSGELKVAQRIKKEMKKIGLKKVSMDEFPVHSWEFTSAYLEILSPKCNKFTLSAYCGVPGTNADGITAEIVDVGKGTATEYENIDAKGKIVLVTIDLNEDYWISAPAYQAELKGAKACIVAYRGKSYGTRPDAINSFDSQCRNTIPVVSISRNDAELLREIIKEKNTLAKLTVEIQFNLDGRSHNVIGLIPGKNQEQYIILGAHMDGYFHAYQDDALGVGIDMAIAKAIIESGYEPEHTIIFIAHGSEEYGISGYHYDWCIGSWYATHELHPEWTGKAIVFLNIDAIRPGTPKYVINSTPELHGFFKEYMMTMTPPRKCWKEGVVLEGLNGPWSDDYNYVISGIPGIICGRGPSEWGEMNYHTQFDNYTAYDSEIVKYTIENYVNMVLSLDSMAIIPLNFKYIMDSLKDTLGTKMVEVVGESANELEKRVREFALNADWYYRRVKEVNHIYQRIKTYEDLGKDICETRISEFVKILQVQNESLLHIYRLIQKHLMKLDQWDYVVYNHEPIIFNYIAIEEAINSLKASDGVMALNKFLPVDLTKFAVNFDKEVYEWLMNCQDANRSDLFWGNGKIHRLLDTYEISKKISEKVILKASDFKDEIKQLNEMLQFEARLLEASVRDQIGIIMQANELLSNLKNIEKIVVDGKAILESIT